MLVAPHTPRNSPAAAPPEGPPSVDALYRAHARRIFRWAQRLGGPGVDAEETLQEVFITINRRLATFRGDGDSVVPWLFQITARVVANQRRSWQRRRLRWAFLSPGIAERAACDAPGPAERIEEREAAERLYRALDHLSERHRNVLILFEFEQLSTDEIVALLRRPPGTVRVWLHRARAAFAKHWRDEVEREHRRSAARAGSREGEEQ